MSFLEILRDDFREAMMHEEEKIDSALFYGQRYVRSDEIFRLENNLMYNCVRSLSRTRIIREAELNDKRYYIRHIDNTRITETKEQKQWLLKILHNPVEYFLWPSDVVFLSEPGVAGLAWLVDYPAECNNSMVKLSDFLEEQNILELHPKDFDELNARRMQIAKAVLRAAKAFFIDAGLRYCNWRADHIYMTKKGNLYVNYTDHIDVYRNAYAFDKSFNDWALYYSPEEENYSDDGDYFSLLILLFYILVGRFPYDGRMMGEMTFDTKADQDYWNVEYRRRALFIFDPEHNENSIGTFAHEKKYVAAWNSLSEDLHKLFTFTFRNNNKMNAKFAFNSIYKMLIGEG